MSNILLSKYIADQEATSKGVNIYTRTNGTTGATFFVLSFPQPGKTVISARTGEEVQASLNVAVGNDTQKAYGLEGCTRDEFKKFIVEHYNVLKINPEASNTIPTCFIENESFDL